MMNMKANKAHKTADKYEQKLDKKELKDIMKLIREAAGQGYTGLVWRGNIRKANIQTLKKLGYKVARTSYRTFPIDW